ncbi:hypothetical protein [Arenibacter latericius]|uniref:hypothetical protein n=1 Tax=Arenibacter latericius TaxID=86104 RepID=UPI00041F363D|nr:hypothetical protein [Arenibacter latericius]
MKNIEQILLLNKYLSTRYLIFNKFNWRVKVLIYIILAGILSLFSVFVYNSFPSPKILPLLLIIPIFLLGIIYSIVYNLNTQKVIKRYYSYALDDDENWTDVTILKIRKKELKKYLNNKDLFKKENLIFLIESVKFHSENKYKLGFLWNTIIILISVYFGGLISGQSGFYENFEEFEKHYKNIAIGMVGIVIFVWLFDNSVLREIINMRLKSKHRLLMTLENIYIQKYGT